MSKPEANSRDGIEVQGLWPARCEQRAFVAGAKWWEFTKTDGTMWPSDVDKAEEEAIRRYGDPLASPAVKSRGKHPAAVALGKMTSVRKQIAARANGRKGGRPKKVKG